MNNKNDVKIKNKNQLKNNKRKNIENNVLKLTNIVSLKQKKINDNLEKHAYFDKSLNDYYNDFYKTIKVNANYQLKSKSFVAKIVSLSLNLYEMNGKVNSEFIRESFDDILKSYNEFFEVYYKINFNVDNFHDKKIIEAMDYSVLDGGKRIRGFLIFLTSYLYMPLYYQFYYINLFSLCIELIHAFSLVHDDLPAIDNDEIRRYKASTWKKFGEPTALLAGDALLNQSYSLIHYIFDYACNIKMEFISNILDNYTPEKYNMIMNEIDELRRLSMSSYILSDSTGIDGMISGELEDTTINPKKLDVNKIKDIYYKKTTKLFEAAMIIPSILVPTNRKINNIVSKISEKLGFAYQLVDDLLEVTSTTEKIGKSVDSDLKNNKVTYVSLVGVDNAKLELLSIKKYILTKCNELEKFEELDIKRIRVFKCFMLYILDRVK